MKIVVSIALHRSGEKKPRTYRKCAHKDYLAPIRTQTAPAMWATRGTPATLKHLGAMPKMEGTKDAKKKAKG